MNRPETYTYTAQPSFEIPSLEPDEEEPQAEQTQKELQHTLGSTALGQNKAERATPFPKDLYAYRQAVLSLRRRTR